MDFNVKPKLKHTITECRKHECDPFDAVWAVAGVANGMLGVHAWHRNFDPAIDYAAMINHNPDGYVEVISAHTVEKFFQDRFKIDGK